MAVRWSQKALLDIADISDFYIEILGESETAAQRAIEIVKRDIRKIAATPLIGRKDKQGLYEYWFAMGSQYRVYYQRLGPKTIKIYRVWPTRRPKLTLEEILP